MKYYIVIIYIVIASSKMYSKKHETRASSPLALIHSADTDRVYDEDLIFLH